MLESETLPLTVLTNPDVLQGRCLADAQGRLGGNVAVYDPNNAFILSLDATASIFAQLAREEDTKFRSFYPVRAQTADELYGHMSDYDYLNMVSTPATLPFRLILNKDELIAKATSYDSDYNAVVIPATTVITLGSRTFGLYYPILIRINKVTNVITVTYDTSVSNPLKTLTTNILTSVTEFRAYNLNLIELVFDAYQFTRTKFSDAVDPAVGYSRTLTLTDSFYAARVYSVDASGNKTEMSYTLSQVVYDDSVPTAMLKLMLDTNTLQINIPQIYFASGLIDNTIYVEIYTTEGALNVAIPQTDTDNATINFDLTSSPYTGALTQPSTLILRPYNTTQISGGANAMSYSDLRAAVINGTIYSPAPITSFQIGSAAAKYGFDLTKYIDNVETRIYMASSVLSDPNTGRAIPLTTNGVLFTQSLLGGDPSTVLQFDDGLVTILPTTIFKYDQSTGISSPIKDAERAMLGAMPKADLATYLNANSYTRQPFHIVLDTAQKYPMATSYNMMDPSLTQLIFVDENTTSASQMSITSVDIEHQANGTGGYLLRLGVVQSEALSTSGVDPSDLLILLTTTTSSGTTVYLKATYLNTADTGVLVYTAVIPSTYHITSDGNLVSQMTDLISGNVDQAVISINPVFTVKLGGKLSDFTDVSVDATLNADLPTECAGYVIFSRQQMTLSLAENLSSVIYNVVDTTWGETGYQTYTANTYYTYDYPIFATVESNGVQVPLSRSVTDTTTNTTTIELVEMFAKGDTTVTGGDFTLSVTTTQSSPSATITVDDVTGLLPGASIQGPGMGTNNTILSVNVAASQITVASAPLTALTSGTNLVVLNSNIQTTLSSAQTTANVLPVASVAGILPGMGVFTFALAKGATVLSVDATAKTIKLSADTTEMLASGTTVIIANTLGPRVVKNYVGDKIIASNGQPIVAVAASNQFNITMMQFDARLYASENADDIAFLETLPGLVVTTAHLLDNVRDNLIEKTYLYYSPYRTIGTASYGVGNGKTTTLPLGMTFDVTLYVDAATLKNTSVQEQITATTLATINTCLAQTIISVEDMASEIKAAIGDTVESIDLSAIDNDTLRTVAVQDTRTHPILDYPLEVGDDGTLQLAPGATITFVLSPSETS